MEEGKYQVIADMSFILGAGVIICVASLLLISSLLFAAGYPLTRFCFPAALTVTAAAVWYLCRHCFESKKMFYFATLLLLLAIIFLACIYAAGCLYDLSWDGQAYHQEAVIQLRNGWNPFHDAPLKGIHSVWINHYAKGPWIAAASLYAVTGHIEQGKAFNFLLIIASFFIALAAFTTHYRERWIEPLVLALLAAGNPVSILQSPTFYVDGQLASMLLIFLALGYLIVFARRKMALPLLALSVIIAVNIKFTALVYILVISAVVTFYLLLKKQIDLVRPVAMALIPGFLAGFFLVGFNPYVTNTLRQGNPFYPLAGPNATDIMTVNSPANFRGMDRFEKLFAAVFSKTEDAYGYQKSHLKLPFTVKEEELKTISVDTRVGGFGPLFGGSVLLSLILLAAAFPADPKRTLAYAALVLLILISALVNPEAWWARYAPQLWLLPVIVVMAGLEIRRKIPRFLGLLIVLALSLNVLLVSVFFFERQYAGNLTLKNQLAEMQRADVVLVKFQYMYSNRVRLEECHVNYREVEKLEGPQVKTLAFSDTRYVEQER